MWTGPFMYGKGKVTKTFFLPFRGSDSKRCLSFHAFSHRFSYSAKRAQPLTREATVPSTDLTASSMRSSEGPPPCAKAADPPPEPPSRPATCLAISPAERPLSLALAPTKQTTLAELPTTKTLT